MSKLTNRFQHQSFQECENLKAELRKTDQDLSEAHVMLRRLVTLRQTKSNFNDWYDAEQAAYVDAIDLLVRHACAPNQPTPTIGKAED